MHSTLWRDASLPEDVENKLTTLASTLAGDVNARDRQGSMPTYEREQLKVSGLTGLTLGTSPSLDVYQRRSGEEISRDWICAFSAIRRLARVDLSCAALLGYNYMTLRRIEVSASQDQLSSILQRTVAGHGLWGGTNNPKGPKAELKEDGDGYRLTGMKTFATGAQCADWIVVGEVEHKPDGSALRHYFILGADTPGITHGDDWNGIGARRSASGSIRFDNVRVSRADIFRTVAVGNQKQTFNNASDSPEYQILFVNLLVGAAQGAINTAAAYLKRRIEDEGQPAVPGHVMEILGRCVALTSSAAALADLASQDYAQLVASREDSLVDSNRRKKVFDLIVQAKVIADRVALDVSSHIFEATGARGATTLLGLDRYWRDVRTFTLHDPVAVRAMDIGAHVLDLHR